MPSADLAAFYCATLSYGKIGPNRPWKLIICDVKAVSLK
ncbi:unknown protein [Parachlamydia acanthamoebae UV-7]|uniref:Uncharacterized protein n=1 Tax=Parachlamydia acanthamoebae (strain UV7) TaxID=765952 RepID=F8KVE2_PARAV|nr:unknown protein [Parachlamydia acanthamoebae UV-7]